MRYERILVPTDFSRGSAAALDFAVELARTLGCSLVLLHVCDHAAEVVASPGRSTTELSRSIRDEAARDLDEHHARTSAAVRDVTSILREGSPVAEILAVAEGKAVDLVVMGTHGRTGVRRVLLGSVAEGVVRLSPVAVITVRADRAHARTPLLRTDEGRAGESIT